MQATSEEEEGREGRCPLIQGEYGIGDVVVICKAKETRRISYWPQPWLPLYLSTEH